MYGDGVIALFYRHRSTLETGHSPFTRLMKRSVDSVNEALTSTSIRPPRWAEAPGLCGLDREHHSGRR